LRCTFWIDFLSALPSVKIYRIFFEVHGCSDEKFAFCLAFFHFAHFLRLLRYASLFQMWRNVKEIMIVC